MSNVNNFDYEKLLALLPRHKLLKLVDLQNAKLLKWNWPPLKSYNGFKNDERIRTWQIGIHLLNVGAIKKPKTCDICKKEKPVGWHSENYFDILSDPFLCKSCHTILHLRFKYPDSWLRLIDKNKTLVDTWYSMLITEEINLARYLKDKLSLEACQSFNSSIS